MPLYIHSNSKECTIPTVNLKVNYRLWMTLTCQCRFINYNKYITLARDVDSEGGCAGVGAGVYGNSLSFLLHFAINLKGL